MKVSEIIIEFGEGPVPEPSCRVFWGSHGCLNPPGHDGNHVCNCDHEITVSGDDGSGFCWWMYGEDSPEELAEYLDLVYEAGNMLPGGRVPPD